MNRLFFKGLAAAGLFTAASAAWAVDITVTSVEDIVGPGPAFADTTANTSSAAPGPLPPPIGDPATPGNGTPGRCTLREAILSAEGDIARNANECTGTGGAPVRTYCPFNDDGRIAGECPEGDPTGPDRILFAPSTRFSTAGPILLDYTLPPITQPLTLTGLGPDQTVVTGDAQYLAFINPPPATTSAPPPVVDLPMFQIHPDLDDGAQVAFDNLQLRGVRVHYFRAPLPRTDNPPQSCGGAGEAACNATEPNKQVINFSGIVMDNAVSSTRKQLVITNARFSCNRRDRASSVGGLPRTGAMGGGGIGTGEAPAPTVEIPRSGGAVAVQGRADLSIATTSFSNNMADYGAGGAVFAGAKDNASPIVSIDGGLFDNDSTQVCQDRVFSTASDQTPLSNSVTSCGAGAGATSSCPMATPAYTQYSPGNYAGAGYAGGTIGGPPPAALPAPQTPGPGIVVPNGGALAVNALNATVGNIGELVLKNSRFISNTAVNSGGAVSLVNVARSDADLPAFDIENVLFGGVAAGNVAGVDGGAVDIRGNASSAASAQLSFVSFGQNTAGNNGGGLHYRTEAGAPIDFTMENVRMSANSATNLGGALHAEDNTIDDSGVLNIEKATFDNNAATGAGGFGGAIFCGATKGESQFINVTISGNSAVRGGGMYVGKRCHLDINNATITNNMATEILATGATAGQGASGGGGIFVAADAANGRVDMQNSILAFNQSFEGNNTGGAPVFSSENTSGPDCSAPNNNILRSTGFNFVGTNTGCGTPGATPFPSAQDGTGACVNPASGDRVGEVPPPPPATSTCTPPLNPLLRVLADNGGPEILGARNFTHLPETNSPVVNNGRVAGCRDGLGNPIVEDERELFRGGQAARCDIGAVELGAGATPGTVTLTAQGLTTAGTSVTLSSTTTTEFEMLRAQVSAPVNGGASLKGIRVQTEDPAGTSDGSYSSVVGLNVYVVDAQGTRLTTLFTSSGPPSSLQSTGAIEVVFNTPLDLAAGESVNLSVTLVYGTSSQLAKSDSAVLLAAAGGFGLLSMFGLLASGLARAAAVLGPVLLMLLALAGCGNNDSGGGTTTPPPAASKNFQISLRQLNYDTGSTTNVRQAVAVIGPSVSVSPP